MLAGLEQELMQEDVLRAFQHEYAAELARLDRESDSLRPDYERERAEVSEKLANLKAAVLKGVDPALFVEEMNQLQRRLRFLEMGNWTRPIRRPMLAASSCVRILQTFTALGRRLDRPL